MSSEDPSLPTAPEQSRYPPHRPSHLDIYFTPNSQSHDSLPSPPYRRVQSSSNLPLHSFPNDSESPAYKSRPPSMVEEYHSPLEEDPTKKPTKLTVQFPDDLRSPSPLAGRPPELSRVDSPTMDFGTPSIAGTDDEESDDYDWSGEEDLVDEEAKFEQAMGVRTMSESFGLGKFITFMFSTLIGSTLLACLMVIPALILHFFWYKPHPTAHRRYVMDNVEAWLFWAAANLVISWYLALIVDLVPILVRAVIAMSWGHVSESIKNKIEMYNTVKNAIKPLFYASSAWVSWIILFEHIYKLYDPNHSSNSAAPYTSRVFQAIEFLFFFTVVICVKMMLSHAIAFSFHRTAFKERLETISEALHFIETLRLYRPKQRSHAHKSSRTAPLFSAFGFGPLMQELYPGSRRSTPTVSRCNTPDMSEELDMSPGHDADVEDADATLVKKEKGHKGKQRKSWTEGRNTTDTESMKQEQADQEDADNPHRYPPQSPEEDSQESDYGESGPALMQQAAQQAARVLKTAVLHDARGIRGDDDGVGGLDWNVTSSREAKRLARSIFLTFKNHGRSYLIPSDFYPAFPTEEKARVAFRIFDEDNNGDITRAEIKTTLIKIYKERRFLSRSMRDVSVALKTLDNMMLIFALVILFFISLSVFGVNIDNALTSIYTIGIGASFIFRNAASNAFDAVMFIFVTHPFDTGDRVFIDDENFVVKKMGLFATIFTRSDGTETYYFNSQLFTKFIINARRSGKTAENLTMQVAWRTPLEKLDALEKCLNEWLATEHNRWFEPSTSVTLGQIDYQRHLVLTIGIGHNGYKLADWGLRNARKTAFHAAVNYYCRQLGIVAYESTLPLAYVDEDTGEYVASDPHSDPPPSPSIVDDTMSVEPLGPEPELVHKATLLGFHPPQDKHVSGIRARRSKSRKVLLRTMGADGG